MNEDNYGLQFLSLIKTRPHQMLNEQLLICTCKALIADAQCIVIIRDLKQTDAGGREEAVTPKFSFNKSD